MALMQKFGPGLPDALRGFTEDVAKIGVYGKYRGSLNFMWDQPDGNPVNLGYIMPDGGFWTTESGLQVDDASAKQYWDDLAKAFCGQVKSRKRTWVARCDGKPFHIMEIAVHLSDWRIVIEDFQAAVRRARPAGASPG